MQFIYTKDIKVTVTFYAPLLGYDVMKQYGPGLEDIIRQTISNHLQEGTFEVKTENDWQIKFEVADHLKVNGSNLDDTTLTKTNQ